MVQINENYQKLAAGYLFPEIARRVRLFQQNHPEAKLIRLGIGDVVLPLVPAVVTAMQDAVAEMGTAEGFHGYGPEQGYEFLRETISTQDYVARGAEVRPEEIFISDGSKCDSGNIQEIFSLSAKIAVADPVYPVYVDTNVMAGRTGIFLKSGHYEGILYLPANEENNFCPKPPQEKVDLVYLCSPNNPTGATMTREQLKAWVDYAKRNHSILLYDAAYEAFITDLDLPHSIYEIPGARDVAIEFRSLSKTAGFTGTRCAWTVVPQALQGFDGSGKAIPIHPLWNRRHCTKFNGVSYPVQKGAAACFSTEGKKQIQEQVSYYLENARIIREGLNKMGFTVFGGINAPYIWARTPRGLDSWSFFDELLNKANIVVTPGSGFGPSGEGYFRLSAFGLRDHVTQAIARIQNQL